MRKIAIAALLAIVSSSVAAEWAFVRGNAFHKDYIDRTTIHRVGDIVNLSNLDDFDDPKVLGNGQYFRSKKMDREYDCKNPRSRTRTVSWFSDNMGSGNIVGTEDQTYLWIPFESSTHTQIFWEIACGK